MPDNYAYLSEVFPSYKTTKTKRDTFFQGVSHEQVLNTDTSVDLKFNILTTHIDKLDTKVDALEQTVYTNITQKDTPPPEYNEKSESLQRQLHVLRTLKPYSRIKRNSQNEIELDTRLKLFRKNDSRWTALDDLRNIMPQCYSTEKEIVQNAIKVLIATTYKHDLKWIAEAESLLQSTKL